MAGTGRPQQPAQWASDPGGRHELRYWDGTLWTDHVSDRGQQANDPVAPVDGLSIADPVSPSSPASSMTRWVLALSLVAFAIAAIGICTEGAFIYDLSTRPPCPSGDNRLIDLEGVMP